MGDSDLEIDRALLRRARSEPEAFGEFYRRHIDWVMAFLSRRVEDPELVADLAAEAFARALIALPRLDLAKSVPNAWLFGIVNHQVHAYWKRGRVSRRAQKRLAMERHALDDDELAAIERLATEPVAVTLLGQLPEDQRDAVRSRVLDERSYQQIAVEQGVPEATIRKRVSRGLAQLRAQLGDDRDG